MTQQGHTVVLGTDALNLDAVLKERRKILLQLDELIAILKALSAPAVLTKTCNDAWICSSRSINSVDTTQDADKKLICTLNCLAKKLIRIQPLSQLDFVYVERITDDSAIVLDIIEELKDHSKFLGMFLEKGVNRLITEQSVLKNKYSDITTLAIFFSSISATALQYTSADNVKITSSAVNTLWVASLVSSIAAAGNGLLAMSWHTSFSLAARNESARRNGGRAVAHDRNDRARRRNGHHTDADDRDHIDSSVLDRWLENCPMAFLVLSGILFIVGLVFYLFVTQQHKIVKIISIALIGGHSVCLARLVTKFMLDTIFEKRVGSLRAFVRAVEVFFMLLSLPLFIIFDIASLTGWEFVDQIRVSYKTILDYLS